MKVDPHIIVEGAPGVYEPGDDSFLLVRAAEVQPGEEILEVGTGTGIVALHCARAGARVTATDINPAALGCAEANAERNRLQLKVLQSDLFSAVEGRFDAILFNPPYLPSDSQSSTSWLEKAWDGGPEGIAVVSRFLREAETHLKPHGRLYVVLSSFGSLPQLLKEAREHYTLELIEELPLFFERLYAYRLRPKGTEATSSDSP